MKNIYIYFFVYLLLINASANEDNSMNLNFLASTTESDSYVYRICKRPLDLGFKKSSTSLVDMFDLDFLEKEDLNTQHFHFFKFKKSFNYANYDFIYFKKNINYKQYIPAINDRKFIGAECEKNNFSNFGFFGDSKIHCNESVINYHTCSTQTFDEHEIKAALEITMEDWSNPEYALTQYNCQYFTKRIIKMMKSVNENGGPVCLIENYPKSSVIKRVIGAAVNKVFENKNQWIFFDNTLKWENQKNQCSIYETIN